MTEMQLHPEVYHANNGWYIAKFDVLANECHYLWAEDLKFHATLSMDFTEFYKKFYYKTKEEAERTLQKWEATYP